jgi:hypothetical protein
MMASDPLIVKGHYALVTRKINFYFLSLFWVMRGGARDVTIALFLTT